MAPWWKHGRFTLVNIQKAIENGHYFMSFPGDFPVRYVNVYKAGYHPVNTQQANWKITIFFIAKSSILKILNGSSIR
jgi:hypothetical protein